MFFMAAKLGQHRPQNSFRVEMNRVLLSG